MLLSLPSVSPTEEIRDCTIVVRRMLESLEGKSLLGLRAYLAFVQLVEEIMVVFRVAECCDSSVVLGGSTE